jgi:hypothetical protein
MKQGMTQDSRPPTNRQADLTQWVKTFYGKTNGHCSFLPPPVTLQWNNGVTHRQEWRRRAWVNALIAGKPEGKPKKVAIYFTSYKQPGMHDFRFTSPSPNSSVLALFSHLKSNFFLLLWMTERGGYPESRPRHQTSFPV